MTIQDLKSIRRKRLELTSLEERIQRLRSAMERCTPVLVPGPRGGSREPDRLGEQVSRLEELERELVARVAELEGDIAGVEAGIAALPEQQAVVMRLRYVDGLSWRGVARRAGYTLGHCKNIHTAAQKKL